MRRKTAATLKNRGTEKRASRTRQRVGSEMLKPDVGGEDAGIKVGIVASSVAREMGKLGRIHARNEGETGIRGLNGLKGLKKGRLLEMGR